MASRGRKSVHSLNSLRLCRCEQVFSPLPSPQVSRRADDEFALLLSLISIIDVHGCRRSSRTQTPPSRYIGQVSAGALSRVATRPPGRAGACSTLTWSATASASVTLHPGEGSGGGGLHPAAGNSIPRARSAFNDDLQKHGFVESDALGPTYNNACWHASPKHEGDDTTKWRTMCDLFFPTPRSTIEAEGLRHRCSSRPVHRSNC